MTAVAVQPERRLSVPQGFIKALSTLKRSINRHSRIPILQNMLVKYDGHVIAMTTTDLEVRATYTEPVEPGDACEFATTIPFTAFADHVKGAKDVSIVNYSGGRHMVVIADGKRRTLDTLPHEEFPAMGLRDYKVGATVEVPLNTFLTDLSLASTAAAKEPVRGATMMGTLLEVEDGAYNVVGTDGHWLGFVHREFADKGPKEAVIMPCQMSGVVGSIKVGKKSTDVAHVAVYTRPNSTYVPFVSVRAAGFEIVARCVDGSYPAYRNVIPSTLKSPRLLVNRKEFLALVQSASKASNWINSMIVLKPLDRRALISVEAKCDDDGGKFEGSQECIIKGTFPQIAFSGKMLATALANLDAETVCLTVKTALSAMHVFNGEQECNEYYLIMPLRQ